MDAIATAVLDLAALQISGLALEAETLWLTSMQERLVARAAADGSGAVAVLRFPHPVADVAPGPEGLWIVAGGGRDGRQCVLWSATEQRALRRFDCPGGAGGGLAWGRGRLWLTHRHNRRLLVLDPSNGAVERTITTEHEVFSPSFADGELWLVETKTGPFGRFSPQSEAVYFFTRFDSDREAVCERLAAPAAVAAMTTDGRRFWYAPRGETGIACCARAELGAA